MFNFVWLNKKGVAFTFDFEQKKKGLENICPEWEEKKTQPPSPKS
jgi:hypothetical protein